MSDERHSDDIWITPRIAILTDELSGSTKLILLGIGAIFPHFELILIDPEPAFQAGATSRLTWITKQL